MGKTLLTVILGVGATLLTGCGRRPADVNGSSSDVDLPQPPADTESIQQYYEEIRALKRVDDRKHADAVSRLIMSNLSQELTPVGGDPLPSAAVDQDGKPLLSWRVLILPRLGGEGAETHKQLYERFRLDEPWDSPHNKQLLSLMPPSFHSPGTPWNGKTCFQLITGPGTVYATPKPLGGTQNLDGTSNTVVLVETTPDRAVFWTKPEDWQYDADEPSKGLRVHQDGVYYFGTADGGLTKIRSTVDAEHLLGLFRIDDGIRLFGPEFEVWRVRFGSSK